ncbi:hypothetical protein [uncultured Gimesia sp.]|uniref:hypothetical protein n=1 Tax=uncultured Gimesia sp. TaxID=1678688 RepID=UPI002615725E|nr:hypothetical protein [uncultured Gimesia sp.]
MGKKIAIGCGVLAVIGVIGVAVAIVNVPKIIKWAEEKMAEEEERQQFAETWNPPAKDVAPEKLFPAKVGNALRKSQDEAADIPDLRFDIKGQHATYDDGLYDVDVYVYQVTELEKEALFGRVQDIYDEGEGKSGMRQMTNMGYRMFYDSSEDDPSYLWFMKGWLFVFRTSSEDDLEPFIMAYLKGIEAEEPAGVEAR